MDTCHTDYDAKRFAAEAKTEETLQYPQEKDIMKQTMPKSKSASITYGDCCTAVRSVLQTVSSVAHTAVFILGVHSSRTCCQAMLLCRQCGLLEVSRVQQSAIPALSQQTRFSNRGDISSGKGAFPTNLSITAQEHSFFSGFRSQNRGDFIIPTRKRHHETNHAQIEIGKYYVW